MEPWRRELRTLAGQVIADFQKKEGVLGVMIGGSLARGQEWRHSDLDLGILVEKRDPNQPEFNVISGRGVEAIQLVRGEIEEQVRLVETGDCDPILTWPFEFWRGRIVSDPTGLLAQLSSSWTPGYLPLRSWKSGSPGCGRRLPRGWRKPGVGSPRKSRLRRWL